MQHTIKFVDAPNRLHAFMTKTMLRHRRAITEVTLKAAKEGKSGSTVIQLSLDMTGLWMQTDFMAGRDGNGERRGPHILLVYDGTKKTL